jgi:hypothetical protein
MATIIASGIGATLTGSPVVVGVLSSSETANNLSFIVAFLVSIFALGAGLGKVYKIWSTSIIASAARDELLSEVVSRLADIEHRQIQIQEEVNRQAAVLDDRK